MTTIEITLVIVGVVFLVGSFLVQDKLSEKDVDQISRLSDNELKIIIGKKLDSAKNDIEAVIDQTIDESKDMTIREMERETNEKIMAISEYSDTVLEAMNQTHNEIMFLYSMLNDKQKDITDLAETIQKLSGKIRSGQNEIRAPRPALDVATSTNNVSRVNEEVTRPSQPELKPVQQPVQQPVVNSAQVENTAKKAPDLPPIFNNTVPAGSALSKEGLFPGNQNIQILKLHKAGKGDVEIAKELNCGLGEVKLVLGLYKGDKSSEI